MSDTLWNLLQVSLVIAIGFLVAVAFYESLSTRDVLVARALRIASRITHRRLVLGLVYVLTVAVGIPALVVFWTVVLEIGLFLIGSVDRLGSISVIAVSIVAAARVLAYVRQRTAHELAKAIPLALAFALITGGNLNLEAKASLLLDRPSLGTLTVEMILFLIALEIGLRLLTDAARVLAGVLRQRRGASVALGSSALMPPQVLEAANAGEAQTAGEP